MLRPLVNNDHSENYCEDNGFWSFTNGSERYLRNCHDRNAPSPKTSKNQCKTVQKQSIQNTKTLILHYLHAHYKITKYYYTNAKCIPISTKFITFVQKPYIYIYTQTKTTKPTRVGTESYFFIKMIRKRWVWRMYIYGCARRRWHIHFTLFL